MSMDNEIEGKLVKAGTVWAAIGITSWADFASFLAALYSLLLLGEWMWKKLIKSFLISRGYIKVDRRRRKGDGDE